MHAFVGGLQNKDFRCRGAERGAETSQKMPQIHHPMPADKTKISHKRWERHFFLIFCGIFIMGPRPPREFRRTASSCSQHVPFEPYGPVPGLPRRSLPANMITDDAVTSATPSRIHGWPGPGWAVRQGHSVTSTVTTRTVAVAGSRLGNGYRVGCQPR